ncbi:unnamed protein product [Closterium sp. NIES-65]|nr:unnamed protein product [Closterium sp. NIES-65]
MELYHHNCDVANPHAVDGRGATHINVSCDYAAPSTSAPCTSTPTFTCEFVVLVSTSCTPTSKHPRVAETASMAAAKLVSDTIKGCHMDAMNKLEGLVRVWMEQDERIVRERMAQSAAAAQARTTATPPDNT